ncbi:DUF5110 domain-containing protein [Streptomyces sp. NPDC006510]|uniref:DUF5110 domain-containing protein n=1 Tax=Streptomyces sp. NPDC006510 TaxID=3155600 RepID=UPI0033B52ABF
MSWEDPARLRHPPGTTGCTLYEGDGVTREFAQGASATQHVRVQAPAHGGKGDITVKIGASVGSYEGKVSARSYDLTVHAKNALSQVVMGHSRLHRMNSAAAFAAADSGCFTDPATGITEIKTPTVSTARGFTVELRKWAARAYATADGQGPSPGDPCPMRPSRYGLRATPP